LKGEEFNIFKKKNQRKKIDEIGRYIIKSDIVKKLYSMIFQSEIFNYFINKIDEFRNYKLIEQIKRNPIPKHVAIIMDGNRRFARELGLSLERGHKYGKEKIKELLEWCFELKIKNLTLYAFSIENFERGKNEVSALMNLCEEELEKALKDSKIHTNQIKINVIGNLESLPEKIKKSAKFIMNKTKDYNNHLLNIALAYGGREEIIHAIKNIAKDVKNNKIEINDITKSKVSSYLYTTGIPDPDLILRTSGEERISNFLLWQLAYSELYFSDVYWPAFRKRDFLKAIITFQKRKRRYGK
jgi:tritrans,polycis-undecaprenyl-diphosphate synthase [geranylgeranyl-diphosphate specific]